MARKGKKYVKEEKGNKGFVPFTRFIATDPNFNRKESGKANVPSLKQSTDMVNRADAVHAIVPTIPQDRFGSFMVEVGRLYQSIRRNNSANAAYTMADLACYLLNVRNVRTVLTQITRTIRASQAVDSFDTGIPFILIGESMGSLATSGMVLELLGGAAQVKDSIAKVNRLVETSLPVGDFNGFKMDDWILSTVYKDCNGEKYSHVMASIVEAMLVQYAVDSSGNVGIASKVLLSSSSPTPVQDHINAVSAAVTALTTNYTNALIAGDIQHAMGNLSYHPIAGMSDIDKPLEAIFDERALRIFKNASVLWSDFGSSVGMSSDITISTGQVSNTLTLSNTYDNVANHSPYDAGEYFISASREHCSVGDVAMNTYLMGHGSVDSSHVLTITNTAGWVVLDVYSLYCNSSVATTLNARRFSRYIQQASSSVQSTAMSGLQNCAGFWSMVDWMPILFMQYATDYQWFWDIDFFARISAENLDTYQSLLITSLYDTAANAAR